MPTIAPLTFTPDDGTDLEAFTVRADTRDLYKLRGFAERMKWPAAMEDDAIRQTYALGWLASKRQGLIDSRVKFDDFVETYAMDTLEDEDAERVPTPGDLRDG